MKTYKELVCELCEYFGFDDLFPYTDTEKIEQRFKLYLDSVCEVKVKAMKLRGAFIKQKIKNKNK